ncbi:MAG: hypothetical protein NT154_36075, partial [Verrucomicrobia bacterium]|nr:hypothetical protein [Verrucomicrobiota bacterium]
LPRQPTFSRVHPKSPSRAIPFHQNIPEEPQKCSARNWDVDNACHRCKAEISPEQLIVVQPRRPQPGHEPEVVADLPLVLPKEIELLDGFFLTDGGTVSLEVKDETGAQYGVALTLSHSRRTGGWRLFFHKCRVVLSSQQHVEILELLKNAHIPPAPESPDGPPAREVMPRKLLIIGDDLKALFGAMGKRDDFLRALRDNMVKKLDALLRSPPPYTHGYGERRR